MGKNRDLNPLDPLPANQVDALNEFVGTLVSPNFELRIRATDATVLEIPAGPGMDQVAAGVGDPADATKARWRWITATVSRAGLAGAARTQDVWITANENSFAPGTPGEVDNTDYSFALAITEAGAVPAGTLKRRIGSATWDGAKFTATAPLVGKGGAANTTQVVKIVGDGSIGPYDFVHGLGTYDNTVEVYETAAPRATLDVRVERPTVDSVRILPDVPIAASGAAVVVSSRGRAAGALPAHGSTHLPGVGADPTALPLIVPPAALPPGVDGQEVLYLADAAGGVIWHLRYRAASTSPYKWECIGGRPLTAQALAQVTITAAANVFVTVAGLSIVQPLAGDYIIDYGANLMPHVASQAVYGYPFLNGASQGGAMPGLTARADISGGGMTGPTSVHRRSRSSSGLPATWTLAFARDIASGSPIFQDVTLAMVPVRVG